MGIVAVPKPMPVDLDIAVPDAAFRARGELVIDIRVWRAAKKEIPPAGEVSQWVVTDGSQAYLEQTQTQENHDQGCDEPEQDLPRRTTRQ